MKKFIFLLLSLFFIEHCFAQSKEQPLILEKQGTFEILSRTDYAGTGCNFTQAEIKGNLQKINDLVAIVRKNQVLTELKGFDGRARIYSTIACQQEGVYGVPSRISFEFASWFRVKDGSEKRNLIEPPEWSFYLNTIQPFWISGFSKEPDFFGVPEKKENVAPGIDVYDGECFVIYNPDRPDYWLPVTVKEAFDVAYANLKENSDEVQWGYIKKMLDEEWAAIPQTDWNKNATLSGMLSRVGTLTGFPKIMKVNPEYWDVSKPKSEIQFITFRMVTNKKFLSQRTQEYLQANSISYHCARFEESLDLEFVKSLKLLIDKK
jgi:hypothetical protein